MLLRRAFALVFASEVESGCVDAVALGLDLRFCFWG